MNLKFYGFGIRGYQLKKVERKKGDIYLHINQDKQDMRCPICENPEIIRKGNRSREFRSIPIGNQKIFIVLPIPRLYCAECDRHYYVKVSFAEPKRRHTSAFRQYASTLLQFSTVQNVANHLDVGWDLIKGIDQSDLSTFQNPSFKDIKLIAIDDIRIGRNQRHITLVLDMETGFIIYVSDGKKNDNLDLFWKKLRDAKAQIQAVVTAMSPLYINAVEENIPQATHVADPFHILELFNDPFFNLKGDLSSKKINTPTDALILV